MNFRNSGLWSSSSSSSSSMSWWTTSIFPLILLATLSLAIVSVVALTGPPLPSSNKKGGGSDGATTTTGTTATTRKAGSHKSPQRQRRSSSNSSSSSIRFACVGNSIQYFNDCPRLLERMFLASGSYDSVQQDSCLRGGASIVSLWSKGNGMEHKFATPNAMIMIQGDDEDDDDTNDNSNTNTTDDDYHYDIGAPTVQSLLEDGAFDYVIINDHTQSPARDDSRQRTLRSLEEHYAPLIVRSEMVPVFLQTAAYRKPCIRGTDDLGTFEDYSQLLHEGYQLYRRQMDAYYWKQRQQTGNDDDEEESENPIIEEAVTRVAPVGQAYLELYRTNRDLWESLYHRDDFHPSPHGTLLQAYVLYMTIANDGSTTSNSSNTSTTCNSKTLLPPTTYDTTWWDRARVMQPAGEDPLPLPTKAEAAILREVAIKVCSSRSSSSSSRGNIHRNHDDDGE